MHSFFRHIHSCPDCFVHLAETSITSFLWSTIDSWTESLRRKGLQINGILFVRHTDSNLCERRPFVFCITSSKEAPVKGGTLPVKGSSITPNINWTNNKTTIRQWQSKDKDKDKCKHNAAGHLYSVLHPAKRPQSRVGRSPWKGR